MSDAFEEIGDSIDYRIVYGAAARVVEAAQRNLRWLQADNPKDVARVKREVQEELRGMLDKMDPGVVNEAIDDAMNGRNPRW